MRTGCWLSSQTQAHREQHSHQCVHFVSLWSNRLQKYDGRRKLLSLTEGLFVQFTFSASRGLTSSCPLVFMFIWTTSAAYMYLCDAFYYIYTYFLEFDFCKIKVSRVALGSHAEQVTEVWQTCCAATGQGESGWPEKCSLGEREKAEEEAKALFSKPMTVTSVIKKRSNTVLKIQVNIAHNKYSV